MVIKNWVITIQYDNNRHENLNWEVSDDDKEEEYYEEVLFIDVDNIEDENTVIEDVPIFDEGDEGNEEYNELLESGNTRSTLVERHFYLTPKVANDKGYIITYCLATKILVVVKKLTLFEVVQELRMWNNLNVNIIC